jgi:hypothetical protein
MTDAFLDLLGETAPPPPAKNKGGRPSNAEIAARELQRQVNMKAAASGRGFEDIGGVQAFRRPVTINFLATVFEHDVQTITKRLVECPYVTVGNRKLYEFKVACSYIVKPRMTPEQFVKTLNSAQMPPEINKVFWDAQTSRVRYKLIAQEAWETHEVAAGFGSLCMTVKESLSTMTESMRERAKLTDEQALLFDAGIEDLRNRMAEKLEELCEKLDSASLFGKPLFGAPGVSTDGVDPGEFEDDLEETE